MLIGVESVRPKGVETATQSPKELQHCKTSLFNSPLVPPSLPSAPGVPKGGEIPSRGEPGVRELENSPFEELFIR